MENQDEEDFLGNQTYPIWIEVKELKGSEKSTASVHYPKIETIGSNMKENPCSNDKKKIQQ